MNTAKTTTVDAWSGLANMLANLIAKYADELEEKEKDAEEQITPSQCKESLSGDSFLCLLIGKVYDILNRVYKVQTFGGEHQCREIELYQ